MIPLLTGVDGKTSVAGKESDTKSLTRAIKMIVNLRIFRIIGVITLNSRRNVGSPQSLK